MTGVRSSTGSADPSLFPLGTVTFLFTDMEGSTALLRRLGRADYRDVLEYQRTLVRDAVHAAEGVVVDTQGDGLLLPFSSARCALVAAVAVLETLMAESRRGAGGVVVVEGPAGIGKSALLRVGRAYAGDAGLQVCGARAGELEVDYPFGVVRQLFEPMVARAADADALFARAAAIARPIVDATAPAPPDPG